MPSIDLPLPLLVELFSPPPAYQDLSDTLGRQDPGEVDWKRQADEVLDGLKIDIEFDRHSRELDVGADANINLRDRARAAEVLAQVGQGWSSAIERLREETRDGVLSDLRRILSPLMQPELAPLRAQLGEVPGQWLACVGTCNALPQFLDIVAKEWSSEGFQWFLGQAAAPGPYGAFGIVETLEALSRKTIAKESAFPVPHVQAVVGWCTRSKHWKTTPEVGGLHLAHKLCNPDGVLCTLLDASSAKLEWDNIRWPTAMQHAVGVASNHAIEEKHIATFLEQHANALGAMFPDKVRTDQDAPPLLSGHGSKVRLDKPSSLCVLADIVANPQRRAAIVSEMEAGRLTAATRHPKQSRSTPRL